MLKIDFHMHTVQTASDAPFEFSMAAIRDYVGNAKLDAIAITNHNIFDLDQFKEICDNLDCQVFPAIEINLDKGHLLLIANGLDLDGFAEKCEKVSDDLPNAKDSLSVERLKEIFPELGQYILLPHYDKVPPVPEKVIGELSKYITAGEVSSAKKFMYCINNKDRLVPVFFSDSRMSSKLSKFPVRQTYLDCDETTFTAIKSCLSDKAKVALSATESNRLFTVFDDGQPISTGLNVVIGERSSGKSYFLDQIDVGDEDIKYLRQFSLVERDAKEDRQRFDKILSDRKSLLTKDYLKPLSNVIEDVIEIDLANDERRVEKYLASLLKCASETERQDSFSKAKLFNEERFPSFVLDELEELIASTSHLINNVEYRATIDKHVELDALKTLIVELMTIWSSKDKERRKKKWVNELVKDIKRQLQSRSAATTIEDIDLYEVAMNKVKVKKFGEAVALARTERIIESANLQGFEIIAKTVNFKGAQDLKNHSESQKKFSPAFAEYGSPYQYLLKLKEIDGLKSADLHNYLVKVEYTILNSHGFPVSGGERSEFNLLQEIQEAQKYDLLLIDEPESSFDNQFLRKGVNELIKDISKSMPVVLVTHNATVGASIQPDYLICTQKEIVDGEVEYRIYSGYPSSEELKSQDGKSLSTYEVTIGCLEAGEPAYNARKVGYENLKS